ncbi:uncharacterized protein LOC129988013 [Argiope bruennichi]|uniref:Uncharacterized protein n=1 Tax=Argiope bruennichi TaxID=94029 RepID=A0A8T0EIS3_ARGBR|nr:uncharacterized protein LOC129988013 [Argiope bruennichi]KAF8771238.1 hypothetical protein HNY73_018684 [Argiope bruennichi]
MDSKNNKESTNMSNTSSHKDISEKSTSGPTVLFFWIWNWFATLPKTITNLYTDIKNGDLLARFTLLDAMLQFIVAVATSCHPQEDGMGGDADEHKAENDKSKDFQVFGGAGRTLRSRTVAANS